jgi:hypothetical protein
MVIPLFCTMETTQKEFFKLNSIILVYKLVKQSDLYQGQLSN